MIQVKSLKTGECYDVRKGDFEKLSNIVRRNYIVTGDVKDPVAKISKKDLTKLADKSFNDGLFEEARELYESINSRHARSRVKEIDEIININ